MFAAFDADVDVLQWLKRDFDSDLLLSKTATVKNNLKQFHKRRFNWWIPEGQAVRLGSNTGATCRIAALAKAQPARGGRLGSQGKVPIISTVKSSATSGSFLQSHFFKHGDHVSLCSHHQQENTFILSQLVSWPTRGAKCASLGASGVDISNNEVEGLWGQAESHRRKAQTCKRDCVNRAAWRKALRKGLKWLCSNSPVDNYVPLCWMRLCPDAIWPARKQWPNFTNHCGVLSVLNTRLDVVGTEEKTRALPNKVQAVLQKSWHWGVGATNLDGCSWDTGLRAGKQQLG